MTDPKLKAKELVEKFRIEVDSADKYNYELDSMKHYIAKQCALIAVEEILEELKFNRGGERLIFWRAVKSEIQNL